MTSETFSFLWPFVGPVSGLAGFGQACPGFDSFSAMFVVVFMIGDLLVGLGHLGEFDRICSDLGQFVARVEICLGDFG